MLEYMSENEEILSLVQLNYLRLEALDLFDRCLTEGNITLMVKFIEKQLAYNPPRLELLSDIADDVQQRLFSLREYHFDVREKVIGTLQNVYTLNMSSIMPSHDLAHYHLINPEKVVEYITDQGIVLEPSEIKILTRMLTASVEMAGQLQKDIVLTERLHTMLLDWLEAFNMVVIRSQWYAMDWMPPRQDFPIH